MYCAIIHVNINRVERKSQSNRDTHDDSERELPRGGFEPTALGGRMLNYLATMFLGVELRDGTCRVFDLLTIGHTNKHI